MPAPRPSLLLAVAASGAALAVATPAAEALPPSPRSYAIVPGVSIGGVKLGMSYETALKTWGAGSDCAAADEQYAQANGGAQPDHSTFKGDCGWRPEPDSGTSGYASILFSEGKVLQVQVTAAQNPKTYEPISTGPYGRFATKKGKVRVGQTIAKLMKRYKVTGSGGGVQIVKKGVVTGFGSSAGRISGVALEPVGFE